MIHFSLVRSLTSFVTIYTQFEPVYSLSNSAINEWRPVDLFPTLYPFNTHSLSMGSPDFLLFAVQVKHFCCFLSILFVVCVCVHACVCVSRTNSRFFRRAL